MAGSRAGAIAAGAAARSAAQRGLSGQPFGSSVSPLLASYQQWSMGRTNASALPRDPRLFADGAFAPLTPLIPTPIDNPPPGSERPEPRRWQYPVAWNLPIGQPGTEGLKLCDFATLRLYSDLYSIARACVQLRKDEITGIGWDIVATKNAGKVMHGNRKAMRDFGERRQKLLAFFRKPDSNYHDFGSWMTAVLEDVFVIDALSLYLMPPRLAGKGVIGSDLAELQLIDGCYSADTEILTENGWVAFPDLPEGARVATRNPKTRALEWQQPTAYQNRPFSGELINFSTRTLDLLVTPNHRMLVTAPPRKTGIAAERLGEDWVVRADDLAEHGQSCHPIPLTAVNEAQDLAAFRVPSSESAYNEYVAFDPAVLRASRKRQGLRMRDLAALAGCSYQTVFNLEHGANARLRNAERIREITGADFVTQPARLPFTEITGDDFAAFMGMWLAEGSVTWHGETGKSRRPTIYVSQRRGSRGYVPYCNLLQRMLGRDCAYNGNVFFFRHGGLAEYLRQFGHAHEKFIPDEIMGMSSRQLGIFWHYYWLGDGDSARQRIITSSRRMADDLQRVAMLRGLWATARSYGPRDSVLPGGRFLPVEHARSKYIVASHDNAAATYRAGRVRYDGHVYCVTVPNTVVYVRRNGKPAWCGNSTIRPLVDMRGAKPQPPNPAYQSYQYGIPRVDLMSLMNGTDVSEMDGPVQQYRGDQMYYLPRWPRSWTVYGQCFDDQTEVLTDEGWKLFRNLHQQEKVATRSPDGEFQWDRPVAYVAKRYDGELLHFRSQVHDFMVTPEHRLLVQRRPKPDRAVSPLPEFRPASWFAEVPGRGQSWSVPACSAWKGSAPDEIVIPGARPGCGKHHRARPLRFSADTWVRFLGWYLSEGWVTSQPELKNYVSIAQADPAKRALIEAMLMEMGVRWRVRERKTGCAEYTFSHEILAAMLRRDCYAGTGEYRSWTKKIPADVMNYPADLLAVLWDTLVLGDGSVSPETGLRRYSTTSPHLRDQLTEVLQKAGAQGWSEDLAKDREHHHQAYRIIERPGSMSQLPVPSLVPYNGMVYCVTVPSGTIYVRRHGRTGWSGNSPLERVIIPVMAHLHKQQYQLNFFTEGTIPGMFVSPGDPAMTPNQIRELQENLNVIAGDQAWKHKMLVLPPGSKVSPQKPPALAGDDDTTLMTQVCMGYSVMPTELGIIPQLGPTVTNASIRMFSQQTQNIHQRKATLPDLKWIAGIFNKIIQSVLGQEDMQWWWEGIEEEQDASSLNADLINQLEHGGLSIDEFRQQNGHDPWDLPLTREPVWATSSGVVPLGAIDEFGEAAPESAQQALIESELAGIVPGGGGNPARPVSSVRPRQPAQEAPGHAIAEGGVRVQGRAAARKAFGSPAAAASEMAALRRHMAKGRDAATWQARHIPDSMLRTVVAASHAGMHAEAAEFLQQWESRARDVTSGAAS